MMEVASLIIANLVIALVIGFLIGYLVGKIGDNRYSSFLQNRDIIKRKKENTNLNPIFKKNSNVYNKPLILSAPKFLKKDDLTRIKSIDDEIEVCLNKMGIFHYDQISQWSNKNCDWADELISLPGYSRDNNWVSQAKVLETGHETPFSQKLKDEKVQLENDLNPDLVDEEMDKEKKSDKSNKEDVS